LKQDTCGEHLKQKVWSFSIFEMGIGIVRLLRRFQSVGFECGSMLDGQVNRYLASCLRIRPGNRYPLGAETERSLGISHHML
jgi:hypothetical protein